MWLSPHLTQSALTCPRHCRPPRPRCPGPGYPPPPGTRTRRTWTSRAPASPPFAVALSCHHEASGGLSMLPVIEPAKHIIDHFSDNMCVSVIFMLKTAKYASKQKQKQKKLHLKHKN